MTGRVGKEVTATSKTYENYRYNLSASLDSAEPKDTGIITKDGNLKLRFYYDLIETTYTVKKFYQQADGNFVEDTAGRRNENGYVGDSIAATTADMTPAADKALYEFDDSVTGTIKDIVLVEDESQNELKLYFVKEYTSYKVEYYYQKNDGSFGTTPDSVSADRAEVAGNTAAVTEADKTPTKSGYVFDNGNINNVLTTIVKPDGTTVLKVYFVYEKSEDIPPVNTGDNFNVAVMTLLIVSGAAGCTIAAKKKRNHIIMRRK